MSESKRDRTRRKSFSFFGQLLQALALGFWKCGDSDKGTDKGDEADDGAGVGEADTG
jgi:hypothetical protein